MVVRLSFVMFLLGVLASRCMAQDPPLGQPHPEIPLCAQKALAGDGVERTAGAFADPHIDVTTYVLDLTVRPDVPLLAGKVTVRALSLLDSLLSFTLDLNGGMHVDSIRSGGQPLAFVQYPLGVTITLEKPYRLNELFSVAVFYHGLPNPAGFGSFLFSTQNGVPWVWSLSEPYGARDWWPCKDNTTDKPDSVDINITCPATLKAGSNGRLLAVTDNGDGTRTYHWAERYRIAVYLVSLAVSNYEEFTDWFHYSPTDSMPVVNYVLPQSLAAARPALAGTIDMLAVFSEKFGLYPFIREKYGHAQFGWGGAMEHQTMTSTSNFAEYTISHELAHQWFGDMITCANWQNLWLNEGFATFCETLYGGIRHGEQEYRAHLGDMMTPAMTAQGSLYLRDTSSVASMFAFNNVYAKGAWVLHMLRHVLGDFTFFASMRAYAADPRFRYASATTEGFRSVCESVSGRSLGFFFDEWVYGEGYPRYTFDWNATAKDSGYEVSVRINQSVTGSVPSFFTMPVDLRLGDGTRDSTVTVMHDAPGQVFRIRLPFAPSSVQLDPDKWILREVLTPDQLPVAFGLLPNYPNPFNPGTSIPFSLPRRGDVSVIVYDLLGREVSALLRGRMDPGSYTVRWDGRNANGTPAAAGIYFFRMTAGDFTATRKMILVR
jgi:aminopeptidase N